MTLETFEQGAHALALLAEFRAELGPRNVDTLDLLANLGTTHWFLSRLPEAEADSLAPVSVRGVSHAA